MKITAEDFQKLAQYSYFLCLTSRNWLVLKLTCDVLTCYVEHSA